ncbi:hypothetical protein Q0F98_00450 [Paenibacillus amylolyticus]|nr:hypothetical protein Q0F98_00450 [Paenibacillus amylolyticus]
MSSDSTLTDEERLVLLCSKPALRNVEVEDFRQLMTAHMDWSRVFGMLHTHGVMGTAWQNIERYFLVKGTEKAVYGKFVSSVKQMYHMQKYEANNSADSPLIFAMSWTGGAFNTVC